MRGTTARRGLRVGRDWERDDAMTTASCGGVMTGAMSRDDVCDATMTSSCP